MKRFIIVLLLFSCLLSQAQTTYYVAATGGNNANKGTSDSPWATLAYAITAVTSGDIIYVLPGKHTISSRLTVPVGVSITGAGETSIISSTVSTQWYATLYLHSTTQGTNGNQSISYIKMDGNSLTAWSAITINARSNVTVHHCTFVDFFKYGVLFQATPNDAGPPSIWATGNKFFNNTLINCSDYSGDTGFGELMFGGQVGMEVYNNTMTNTSRAYRKNGYCIKYWADGYDKGLKIHDNILTRADDIPGDPYYDFCIELWHIRGGCEIFNNTMTGGIDFGGGTTMICLEKGTYDFGAWVHDNNIGYESPVSNTIGIYLERNTEYAIIERNLFKNIYNGINITPSKGETAKNHIIRYNIFNNMGYYGIWSPNGQTGAFARNIDVLNNVFYSTSGGLVGVSLLSVGTTTNFRVVNNIIQGFTGGAVYGNAAQGQTTDYLTIKNNILYKTNVLWLNSLIPTNYTNSGNINNDPLFYSQTNFHVKSGSPAIKAGVKIEDFLLDFDEIKVGDPPNIGCFETIEVKSHFGVKTYVKSLGFLLILILSSSTWTILNYRSRK